MCTSHVMRVAVSEPDRRKFLRAGGAAVAGALFGGAAALAQNQAPKSLTYTHVADLTHPLTADFPLYPSPVYTPFKKAPIAEYAKDGFFANRWEVIEHCGTHMDAPAHFAEGQADM